MKVLLRSTNIVRKSQSLESGLDQKRRLSCGSDSENETVQEFSSERSHDGISSATLGKEVFVPRLRDTEGDDDIQDNEKTGKKKPVDDGSDGYNYVGSVKDRIIPVTNENTAVNNSRHCCSNLTYIQGLDELTSIRWIRLGSWNSLHFPTKRLFQIYSEFEEEITISVDTSNFLLWRSDPDPQWPDWMIEPPFWTSESRNSESTTVYAHLLPNESHNFMGIVLCFSEPEAYINFFSKSGCSVKNTTSGFIWRSDNLYVPFMSVMMVIVPKSKFLISDDHHRIEVTADHAKVIGIHLLYKTKPEMIEDGLKGLTSIRTLHLEGCNSTFVAFIFTKCFFQAYSEFCHPVQISASLTEFPYWIRHSSENGSTMCLDWLPNVSRYFLGMILCFKSLGSSTNYTIKNTTSDFIWSGSFYPCSRNALMMQKFMGFIYCTKTNGQDSTTVNED
ncbi:hypothetical protein POM88_020039 [Heracleum sosnowskyi]|uniref:Uncharacterized protein n=1 Tax=Heracleum sosnowskyi TaxID=360622 RepID=A0AAD8IC05_9APIA|nr:hypothetical protein POM88_020039 [Heracleum sosnowskyi]